jgi:GAF domain-containing protein
LFRSPPDAQFWGLQAAGQGLPNLPFFSYTAFMFEAPKGSAAANPVFVAESVEALLEGETDLIAGLANVSAALNCYLSGINWVGFYLLKGTELVLGPFQGLPACARIGEGKGVCGRAALDQRPVIVPDVRKFPGHIACDSASASELVIPLFRKGRVFGVLDLDSPLPGRFTEFDAEFLGRVCACINAFLDRNEF